MTEQTRRDRRAPQLGLVTTVLALVGGLGLGWAGRTLLEPAQPLPSASTYTVIAAANGSVGRTLDLNATADWGRGQPVFGHAEGTVTAVGAPGTTAVSAGTVLYEVDLAPVVVLAGDVPAFRELRLGLSGPDVTQLQQNLRDLGFRLEAPDGTFDDQTATEVRGWQTGLGLPETGVVPRGAVVFLPGLPATVALSDELVVGSPALAGALVAQVLPAAPAFSVPLTMGQVAMVDVGMAVQLHHGDTVWEAQIAGVGAVGADGIAVASLGPAWDASTICGDGCAAIPAAGDSAILTTIEVVPAVSGPVVPSQALVVGDDGTAAVVTDSGEVVPVTVLASAGGRAVVEGLDEGQLVRVPTTGS